MTKATSFTVERVLQANEMARNSDSVMIIDVLNRMGAHLSGSQISVIKTVNFESLRRTRQKFQEAGKYEPTDPKVRKARGFKELQIQQRISQTKPERTLELIDEVPPHVDYHTPAQQGLGFDVPVVGKPSKLNEKRAH